MSKQDKIDNFDPNAPGSLDAGLFGLPFTTDEAEVVVIPVPWDVTTSARDGTSGAPEAVLKASSQVDLYYPMYPNAWEMGIAMHDIPMEWLDLNRHYRKLALDVIEKIEKGTEAEHDSWPELTEINEQCRELVDYVHAKAAIHLDEGKLVAILGGDHSTPLGLIRALSEKHGEMGILQIDAHADLRPSYEGFQYSHASIMHNALTLDGISKLVPVGLRDVCEQEMAAIHSSNSRVVPFFDEHLKAKEFAGIPWDDQCADILKELPDKVYISFDIDGLQPELCPATGTPVPGGLRFEQMVHLLKKLTSSGRTIVGFDLCEVGCSDSGWDANVGARILWHLCNQMGISNDRMPKTDD